MEEIKDLDIQLPEGNLNGHKGYSFIRIDFYHESEGNLDAVIKMTPEQAKQLGEWLIQQSK